MHTNFQPRRSALISTFLVLMASWVLPTVAAGKLEPPNALNDETLCIFSTYSYQGQRHWTDSSDYANYVQEAKGRGLSCDTNQSPPAPQTRLQLAIAAFNQGNFQEAFEGFRALASEGNPNAQYSLARMYQRDDITDPDNTLSYFWFSVAALNGDPDAKSTRAFVAERMRPEQITAAQNMFRTCVANQVKACSGSKGTIEPIQPPKVVADGSGQTNVMVSASSGFLVSNEGHLVTNNHAVENCDLVAVHFQEGPKKLKVLAIDETNDLALLKGDFESDLALAISTTNAKLLDEIIVAGFPLSDTLSSSVKVNTGVVSSLAGIADNYSQIQIDAALQPGNSGGPILDERGNVVAVAVASLNKENFRRISGFIPENTNFGIKASTLRSFLPPNRIKLTAPNTKIMERQKIADLVARTTYRISCWETRYN